MRDISRLPKWAQQHIASLERNLATERAKLAAGPEDSNTFADFYAEMQGGSVRPLGRDETITFVLNADRRQFIAARLQHGALYVNGSHSFAVEPHSSNAVSVRLEDR